MPVITAVELLRVNPEGSDGETEYSSGALPPVAVGRLTLTALPVSRTSAVVVASPKSGAISVSALTANDNSALSLSRSVATSL